MYGINIRNFPVKLSLSHTSKKNYVFLIIFYVFFFYKIREQEGRTGSAQRQGRGMVLGLGGRYRKNKIIKKENKSTLLTGVNYIIRNKML
jgi:hypothetical protein